MIVRPSHGMLNLPESWYPLGQDIGVPIRIMENQMKKKMENDMDTGVI